MRKLTRNGMRMAIVKDVLALLDSKDRKIKVKTGNGYLVFRGKAWLKQFTKKTKDVFGNHLEWKEGTDDVDLSGKITNCEVCAKGAFFLADVDRNDKLKLKGLKENFDLYDTEDDQTIDWESLRCAGGEKRVSYFTDEEMNAIELVFEGAGRDWYRHKFQMLTPKLRDVAMSGEKTKPADHLRNICNALIASKCKVFKDETIAYYFR